MEPMHLTDKDVVVMGLGRFGGGIAVTRWLVEQGARVTVTDMASEADLARSVAQLGDLPVTLHLGGHEAGDLDRCDLLVVSPAVPKDRSPFVAEAVRRGIPISSEMNLFVDRCRSRCVVGITGSAGKSTTTAMLGAILDKAVEAGQLPGAWMGGNIGKSLLVDLDRIEPEHVVVLELSSFQLEDLAPLRWSPQHAVITNIKPNHLDRHGTMEGYTEAKMNIVRYQSREDHVYIHTEDNALAFIVAKVNPGVDVTRFAFPDAFHETLQIPGKHNELNAAAAIAVARALSIDDDVIADGIRSFHGLPHRLAFVAEKQGVRYYNDSKSTTPESTMIAVDAFDQPVIALVGGKGKGASFAGLGEHLAARCRGAICYGLAGPEIAEAIRPHAGDSCVVHLVATLADAVAGAASVGRAGDVVVLSPACTSYDAFVNYEQRGETFCALVATLP